MRGSGWQGLCCCAALALVLVCCPLKEVMGCSPPAQVLSGDAVREGASSSTSPCCHCGTLLSALPGCHSVMFPPRLPRHLPFHSNCCVQLLSGGTSCFSSSFGGIPAPCFPLFQQHPFLTPSPALPIPGDSSVPAMLEGEQLWAASGRADVPQWDRFWMLLPADNTVK